MHKSIKSCIFVAEIRKYQAPYENKNHPICYAGYSEAIQPSKNYDIPFKNQMIDDNPGKDIIFLILHNYGAPIRY